jgi:glycosyltransferase 2 family protein
MPTDKENSMNKYGYWIGFILSLFFLVVFFRKIDLASIWNTFQSVEYLYVLPFILVNLFSVWIRAKRWQYLLAPIKKCNVSPLFYATAIGFMANNILPARVGELVRAYVLGSKEMISKTASFATIVVERLFDGFTILLIFLAVILWMPFPPDRSRVFTQHHIKMVAEISFFVYLIILGLLLALRFHNEKASRWIGFFLKRLPHGLANKISKTMESFVSGLDILQRTRDILVIIGYSLFLWVSICLSYYFLFLAFHFDLPVLAAFFLLVVVALGVSIPSAPGYIGTFHWACAAALIFLGIEVNLAKSFSLLLWFAGFIPTVLLGLFSLWREGMSLRQLKEPEKE